MKEIYRSFEGKLNAENQFGYIVYELKNGYEIRNISVWTDMPDGSFRVTKPLTWSNIDEIAEACFMVENGTLDGQALYKGKWYSTDVINDIQRKHNDGNWKRYV